MENLCLRIPCDVHRHFGLQSGAKRTAVLSMERGKCRFTRIPRTAFLVVFRGFVGARIAAIFPDNPGAKTSIGRD